MKVLTLFGTVFCLSCTTLAVSGQGQGTKSSTAPISSDSSGALVTRIEPIPGLSVNTPRKESSVMVNGTTIEFEVYYGGSACDDISYTFDARSDSLHVVERSGACYRHGQSYGVKGVIKNLKAGKYIFAVVRRFEENRSLAVFQKEVVVP